MCPHWNTPDCIGMYHECPLASLRGCPIVPIDWVAKARRDMEELVEFTTKQAA